MGYSLEGRKELDMTKRLHFTTYLLEWLKSRALTPPNVNEDVEQQELSFVAGSNEQWYSYIGRQLGVSSLE